MHLPLALAAYTGLRRGEVLGLRWSDIDLNAAELHVRQAATFIGREVTFTEPKTERALRTVPLPAALVALLRRAKANQAGRRLIVGEPWRDLGLVVDNGDGSPVHPERMTRYFVRLVARIGIEVRVHDLRHAYISELLSRGVSALAVSRVAGHASASFTMGRYGHRMPRDDDAVRAALSLGGAR
jgi:integrase